MSSKSVRNSANYPKAHMAGSFQSAGLQTYIYYAEVGFHLPKTAVLRWASVTDRTVTSNDYITHAQQP